MSSKGEEGFISHYIPDYLKFDPDLIGAYGPRWFNMHDRYNQVNSIIELCRENPTTKNAIIQIFDIKDLANQKRGTCTLSLQFIIRNEKLTLITTMRSNDAYLGMLHDIYSFTMLQEVVASELGYDVGEYIHNVGSLHIYKDKIDFVNIYLNEGIQASKAMPDMPLGNSIKNISWLLKIEEAIRIGNISEVDELWEIDNYWKDLVRLLLVYTYYKEKQVDKCIEIHDKFHFQLYKVYVMDIINRLS